MLNQDPKESHDALLSSRHNNPEGTRIEIGDIEIGGTDIVIMAGPCAVESLEQLSEIARVVKAGGGMILRGGAFKPRSSPYSFQGLGEEGLQMLDKVRQETGLAVVTEVMDTRQVEMVAGYSDILQIGSRNMQNFPLLREVGMCRIPILLKRGMMATINEFLLAAEYILKEGNEQIILCERGIRTFNDTTRNTLDLGAVPLLKQLSHLPVIVDPSHGTGLRQIVPAMAKAAVAAGADGLLIEVHNKPSDALSDGQQSLYPEEFVQLIQDIEKVAQAIGRKLFHRL